MSHFKTKPSLLCYGPFVDWVNTVIDASTVEGRFGSKVGRIWVEVGCFGLNSSPNQLYFPQSFSHWGEFKLAGCKGEGWMGASHPIISKVKHQHFLSQPPAPHLKRLNAAGVIGKYILWSNTFLVLLILTSTTAFTALWYLCIYVWLL